LARFDSLRRANPRRELPVGNDTEMIRHGDKEAAGASCRKEFARRATRWISCPIAAICQRGGWCAVAHVVDFILRGLRLVGGNAPWWVASLLVDGADEKALGATPTWRYTLGYGEGGGRRFSGHVYCSGVRSCVPGRARW
jgi:hypothetical protein